MTFTWIPSDISETRAPRVRVAKFGDGYEQRAADGINANLGTWELRFSVTAAVATAITNYLSAAGGVTSFLWTPPGGTQVRVVCRKWSVQRNNLRQTEITATFEQVPL